MSRSIALSTSGCAPQRQRWPSSAAIAPCRSGFGDVVSRKVGQRDDQPARAVAALRGVLVEKRALHGVELAVSRQTLDRDDLAALELGHGADAAQHLLAVGDHRAGPALLQPAAELGAHQPEPVAQHVDQRRVRVRLDLADRAVDGDGEPAHAAYAAALVRARSSAIRRSCSLRAASWPASAFTSIFQASARPFIDFCCASSAVKSST